MQVIKSILKDNGENALLSDCIDTSGTPYFKIDYNLHKNNPAQIQTVLMEHSRRTRSVLITQRKDSNCWMCDSQVPYTFQTIPCKDCISEIRWCTHCWVFAECLSQRNHVLRCINCRVVRDDVININEIGWKIKVNPYICSVCTAQGVIICNQCSKMDVIKPKFASLSTSLSRPGKCLECLKIGKENKVITKGFRLQSPILITNTYRPFGVEIEVYFNASQYQDKSRTTIERHLENMKHEFCNIEIGTDRSISPSDIDSDLICLTKEIRVGPTAGDRGLETLWEVAKELRYMGFRANQSCGLHVHVDVADFTQIELLRLYETYMTYRPQIRGLVEYFRIEKQCCGINRSYDKDLNNRYTEFNIASVKESNTVEFRLHHGTTLPDLIVQWTLLCIRFVENSAKNKGVVPSVLDFCNLSKRQKKFWVGRRNRYKYLRYLDNKYGKRVSKAQYKAFLKTEEAKNVRIDRMV